MGVSLTFLSTQLALTSEQEEAQGCWLTDIPRADGPIAVVAAQFPYLGRCPQAQTPGAGVPAVLPCCAQLAWADPKEPHFIFPCVYTVDKTPLTGLGVQVPAVPLGYSAFWWCGQRAQKALVAPKYSCTLTGAYTFYSCSSCLCPLLCHPGCP